MPKQFFFIPASQHHTHTYAHLLNILDSSQPAPKCDEHSDEYKCQKWWWVLAPPTNHISLVHDVFNEYLIFPPII